MNANMKRTLMALAVTALFGTSAVYAHNDDHGKGNSHSNSVTISKHVSLASDVSISGDPKLSGALNINAAAVAIEEGSQSSVGNAVLNQDATSNTSTIDGKVGSKSSGNIGTNVASGDNNAQANSAAIAAAGAGAGTSTLSTQNCTSHDCNNGGDPSANSGGMADAEAFADQAAAFDMSGNAGTTNSSHVGGNAFKGASGNIGVNVASGDDNQQLNGLAASTTKNNVYATATASTDQHSLGNFTANEAGGLNYCDEQSTTNTASLSGNAFANASGNIGVNVAAGTGNMQANTLSMAVAGQ